MFPDLLYKVSVFFPFRAIYAIPISILTSSMDVNEVYASIAIQMMWLMIMYIAVQIVWHAGRNKLIVQGGSVK